MITGLVDHELYVIYQMSLTITQPAHDLLTSFLYPKILYVLTSSSLPLL